MDDKASRMSRPRQAARAAYNVRRVLEGAGLAPVHAVRAVMGGLPVVVVIAAT